MTCRRCPHQKLCEVEHCEWRDRRSLAELAAAAEAECAAPSLTVQTIEEVYDYAHLQVFGRRSRRKRSTQNNTIFGRLLALCLREGADPETYCVANMLALKDSPTVQRVGFLPSMLSGENAKGRYNAFVRKSNRRYKRARGDTFAHRTSVGSLREELYRGESEVGELYVQGRLASQDLTWVGAIELCDPPQAWLDAQLRNQAHRQRERLLGARLDLEVRLARLRAAVTVVESVSHGLSTRIGLSVFSWKALSDLLVQHYVVVPVSTYDFDDVPGMVWR